MDVEKGRYFCGFAKIKIDNLRFPANHSIGIRTLDANNINRLIRIFETEGCNRFEPEHRIAVKINDSLLQQALSRININHEQLQDPYKTPLLELGASTQLLCAQGRHRVEAARKIGEEWWVVELYRSVIPDWLWIQLHEETSNETNFSDGDIYRAFRNYEMLGNHNQAQRWFNRFISLEKRKIMKRLQSKPNIRRGFDRLIPYGALWSRFTADNFRTVLDMGHHEQVSHYLNRIHQLWSTFLPENEGILLDSATVNFMEGMMPKYSEVDRTQISQAMVAKRLFPLVERAEQRENIQAVAEACGRIVSLHTMSEDLTYLAPCAAALRHLRPNEVRRSISEALLDEYRADSPQQQIEISDGVFQACTASRHEREIALVQLWLFTWRHFVRPFTSESDSKRKKKVKWLFDHQRLKNLARLATRVGFNSQHIRKMNGADSAIMYAQEFLDLFSGQSTEETGDHHLREARDHFIRGLRLLFESRNRPSDEPVNLTTNDPQQSAARRFNSPTMENYIQSRLQLFLQHVCCPDQPAKLYPTPLAVSREVLFAFFDRDMLLSVASSLQPIQADLSIPEVVIDSGLSIDGSAAQADFAGLDEAQSGPVAVTPPIVDKESLVDGSLVVVAEPPAHVEPDSEGQVQKRARTAQESDNDEEVVLDGDGIFEDDTEDVIGGRHPSGTPDRERAIILAKNRYLAPGFDDPHNVGELGKDLHIALLGHNRALDVVKTWDEDKNPELIVFYFTNEWMFWKIARKEGFELEDRLRIYTKQYKMLAYCDGKLRLLDDPVKVAIEAQLIVCTTQIYKDGRHLIDYLSNLTRQRDKRKAN